MQFSEFDRRFICLHYIDPKPFHRYIPLLQENPALENLELYSEKQWKQLFNQPGEKSQHFRNRLAEVLQLPIIELLQKSGCTPIPYFHENYPKRLKELYDPPAVLYTKGLHALLERKNFVAVIGSRKATDYSEKALDFIIPPLVAHQIPIVSGLAAGADALAHKSAVYYGGETIAVLGHGFSHMYPKCNEKLAEELARNHLLVTEYPPYIPPARWTFPMRNRIISGLSDAVAVTESAAKSGTMSTVEHALDHGKEIFAVPGAIHLPLSAGPNKLLDEGAKPLWSGFQIIDLLR